MSTYGLHLALGLGIVMEVNDILLAVFGDNVIQVEKTRRTYTGSELAFDLAHYSFLLVRTRIDSFEEWTP